MRVLSVMHGPNVPGGVFDEVVEAAPGTSSSAGSCRSEALPSRRELRRDHGLRGRDAPRPGRAASTGSSARKSSCGRARRRRSGRRRLPRRADARARAPAPGSPPRRSRRSAGSTSSSRRPAATTRCSASCPPRTEAFQWHSYTFGVPDQGAELARSAVCTQAFRAGKRAWGHPVPRRGDAADGERVGRAEDGAELPVPPEEFVAEARRASRSGTGTAASSARRSWRPPHRRLRSPSYNL